MTKKETTNIAASVRQRLLNRARAERRVFQELATFYAMERFLFRLAASAHVDRFVLKGGVMTLTWAGEYGRPTRDVDLLGWGESTTRAVASRLADILRAEVPPDGVQFDLVSVEAEAMHDADRSTRCASRAGGASGRGPSVAASFHTR